MRKALYLGCGINGLLVAMNLGLWLHSWRVWSAGVCATSFVVIAIDYICGELKPRERIFQRNFPNNPNNIEYY